MGKSTISMTIFNSYVKLPEGISWCVDENTHTKHWHLNYITTYKIAEPDKTHIKHNGCWCKLS
jgi:hypothetical protein